MLEQCHEPVADEVHAVITPYLCGGQADALLRKTDIDPGNHIDRGCDAQDKPKRRVDPPMAG